MQSPPCAASRHPTESLCALEARGHRFLRESRRNRKLNGPASGRPQKGAGSGRRAISSLEKWSGRPVGGQTGAPAGIARDASELIGQFSTSRQKRWPAKEVRTVQRAGVMKATRFAVSRRQGTTKRVPCLLILVTRFRRAHVTVLVWHCSS